MMSIEVLIVTLLIGAVSGWLAGQLIRGFGFGLAGNIVLGIVGAFVAGAVLPRLGISFGSGLLGAILHATFGAALVLFLIRLIKRA